MEELLIRFTQIATFTVDGIAVAFLLIGSIQVCINGLRVMLVPGTSNHEKRAAWLQYSQWLLAALTLQLGADILETAVAPSWKEIGKLGAIAVIRTFLNYFLGMDMSEIRERDSRRKLATEANAIHQ